MANVAGETESVKCSAVFQSDEGFIVTWSVTFIAAFAHCQVYSCECRCQIVTALFLKQIETFYFSPNRRHFRLCRRGPIFFD